VVHWLVPSPLKRLVFAAKEGLLLEKISGGTNASWRSTPVTGMAQYSRFYADATGGLWYRRADGRVARSVNGAEQFMALPSGATNFIYLAGDGAGRIAVASAEGFFVWTNGAFQNAWPAENNFSAPVRWMAADGQGGWWLEVGGRLRHCRDRAWLAEAKEWREQKRSASRIRWEQCDGAGGLWLAYTDGGVMHVSAAGDFSLLTTKDGLPSNRVRTMTQDREGNF
jgi:ligand-binding sensor domain-containing protein